MPRYTELKEKVDSLRNLLLIVGALKSLAGLRLQDARATLLGIRSYASNIDSSLRSARRLIGQAAETSPSAGKTLVVAFTSEHGFVGNLNSKVLDCVAKEMRAPSDQLVVVGARGATLAVERGYTPRATFAAPSHVAAALQLANQLTESIYEYIAAGDIARLVVCQARPIFDAEWEVVARTLLPYTPAEGAAAAADVPPLVQMPAEKLVTALIDEWLFAEIMTAYVESFASENAARLVTMESVHANVTTKAELYEHEARVRRQEDVTTELLDIVVGAQSVLQRPTIR